MHKLIHNLAYSHRYTDMADANQCSQPHTFRTFLQRLLNRLYSIHLERLRGA